MQSLYLETQPSKPCLLHSMTSYDALHLSRCRLSYPLVRRRCGVTHGTFSSKPSSTPSWENFTLFSGSMPYDRSALHAVCFTRFGLLSHESSLLPSSPKKSCMKPWSFSAHAYPCTGYSTAKPLSEKISGRTQWRVPAAYMSSKRPFKLGLSTLLRPAVICYLNYHWCNIQWYVMNPEVCDALLDPASLVYYLILGCSIDFGVNESGMEWNGVEAVAQVVFELYMRISYEGYWYYLCNLQWLRFVG